MVHAIHAVVGALAVAIVAAPAQLGAQARRDSLEHEIAVAHFKPRTLHDQFKKTTTTVVDVAPGLGDGDIHCGDDVRVPEFSIMLFRIDSTGRPPASFLQVEFRGASWLLIDADSPIQFLVGDSVLSLPLDAQPSHDLDSRGDIRELAEAEATGAQLRTLASADSTIMRITGQRGTCDVRLNARRVRRIYLFARSVMRDSIR